MDLNYLICEDSSSGRHFWYVINEFILKRKYVIISVKDVNNELKLGDTNTLGISVIYKFIEKRLTYDTQNNYLIVFDSDESNPELIEHITKLKQMELDVPNIRLFEYTCFEELLLGPGNIEKFIPDIKNNEVYKIIRDIYDKFGLGRYKEIVKAFKENNIVYSSIEKKLNRALEKSVVVSKSKIGKREYKVLKHFYIYKGGWSHCWDTDCTLECPYDKCWEANGKNSLMCEKCDKKCKSISDSCKLKVAHYYRKFAEEDTCDKRQQKIDVPDKLRDKIKVMFEVKEILELLNEEE